MLWIELDRGLVGARCPWIVSDFVELVADVEPACDLVRVDAQNFAILGNGVVVATFAGVVFGRLEMARGCIGLLNRDLGWLLCRAGKEREDRGQA